MAETLHTHTTGFRSGDRTWSNGVSMQLMYYFGGKQSGDPIEALESKPVQGSTRIEREDIRCRVRLAGTALIWWSSPRKALERWFCACGAYVKHHHRETAYAMLYNHLGYRMAHNAIDNLSQGLGAGARPWMWWRTLLDAVPDEALEAAITWQRRELERCLLTHYLNPWLPCDVVQIRAMAHTEDGLADLRLAMLYRYNELASAPTIVEADMLAHYLEQAGLAP